MAQYAHQSAKPNSFYSTNQVAQRKYGGYDPNQYDYTWNGAYLDRAKKTTYEEAKPELLQTAGQKKAEDFYTNQLGSNTAYQGQRTAQNPYEDQIRQNLSSYLNRETPAEYGLAGEEYRKTLQGDYDPSTSQYYQGMRQTMDMNLSDALNRYGRESYLKGNLRSSATDTGQARMMAENTAQKDQLLGQLALQERQNRLASAGSAVGLGQIYDSREAGKLNTLTGTSSYLQQLKQQELDRQYQDYLQNQQYQTGLAGVLYSTPQTYAYPQYKLD